MENKKCLQCNKELKAVEERKYTSLKTGVVKIYLNEVKKQKYCNRRCYELFYKGKPQTGLKLYKSRESVKKAIEARKNDPKVREKWIAKMKEVTLGENNPNWVKDRSEVVDQSERGGSFYGIWRRSVMRRDENICRINNKDCDGKLEVHHILSWKSHPELRFNINNGISLCHAHHPRVRSKEKRLSPYFMDLVSVSK
jgi:hypothetical protein